MSDDLKERLREWKEPSETTYFDDKHLEGFFSTDVRHKSGSKPIDYLHAFLMRTRLFAYATRDGSWGELEKHLSICLRNLVRLMRLSHEAADRIEALEARVAELEGALQSPNAVHLNTLRGTIAKLTPAQLFHVYGVDALRAALKGQSNE